MAQGDGDDLQPTFVETVWVDEGSPAEPPGQRSLAVVLGLVVVGLAGLVWLALASGSDDGRADDVVAPAEEPDPSPTPPKADHELVERVRSWGLHLTLTYELTTDGDEFCLSADDPSFETQCASLDDRSDGSRLLVARTRGAPRWCVAAAVDPAVDSVTVDYSDGTWARLGIARSPVSEHRFAVACRADGTGLVRLEFQGPLFTTFGSDGSPLVEPDLGPQVPAVRFDAPAGWTEAQIGRVTMVANHRIQVEPEPPIDGTCATPMVTAMANLPDDGILAAAVALDGLDGVPERRSPIDLAPVTMRNSVALCLSAVPLPDVRAELPDIGAARFSVDRQAVAVAVVVAEPVTDVGFPSDPVTTDAILAVDVVDRAEVLPGPLVGPDDVPAPVPLARLGTNAHWTGAEVLVWGGRQEYDTWVLDPALARVREVPGGYARAVGFEASTLGGRYDPATGAWTPMAPVELGATGPDPWASVWTGTEMLVWSRDDPRGAAYDPSTDSWRILPAAPRPPVPSSSDLVWTGAEVLFPAPPTPFPPDDDSTPLSTASLAFDPGTEAWRELSAAPLSFSREAARVWTGEEVVVFTTDGQAAAYDPADDTWREIDGPADSDRSARPVTHAYWDGRAIVSLEPRGAGEEAVNAWVAPPPFDRWVREELPSRLQNRGEVVEVDGGILALAPPAGTSSDPADRPVAYFRRAADGGIVAVDRPNSRCRATPIALPGQVLLWGGHRCGTPADELASWEEIELPD